MTTVLGEKVDAVRVGVRAAVVCLIAWIVAAVPLMLFEGVQDPATVLDGGGVASLGMLVYVLPAVLLAAALVAWLYSRPRGVAWWHARERRWIFAGAVTAGQVLGVLLVCLVVGIVQAAQAADDGAVTMAWARSRSR